VEHRDDGVVQQDTIRAIAVMGVRQPHPGFDLNPIIDGAGSEALRDEQEEIVCLLEGRWNFAYPEMLVESGRVVECASGVRPHPGVAGIKLSPMAHRREPLAGGEDAP